MSDAIGDGALTCVNLAYLTIINQYSIRPPEIPEDALFDEDVVVSPEDAIDAKAERGVLECCANASLTDLVIAEAARRAAKVERRAQEADAHRHADSPSAPSPLSDAVVLTSSQGNGSGPNVAISPATENSDTVASHAEQTAVAPQNLNAVPVLLAETLGKTKEGQYTPTLSVDSAPTANQAARTRPLAFVAQASTSILKTVKRIFLRRT